MRDAFADEMLKLATEDETLVLLSADTGNRLFDAFKERFRDRFINCGIAEANMITVAVGLAKSGYIPFTYAIGAIAAIAHDVIITLGVFSILGYEISLSIIAAFLTIVGYSLNDTIVIFDRIRENMKSLKRESVVSIVNKSINESLSRTIVTSLTTLFVVLTLYFFGGEVIHYFSFALIVGVLIGTYSSIFVASLIVVYMQPKT